MVAKVFKKEEMMKVGKIAKRWGVSRQHVYNLIDRGELAPAFRFGGRRGMTVPLPVVENFEKAAEIEPNV